MNLPARFGDYVLLRRLGHGAAGDVFLARPREERSGLPSPVVIKRLHEALSSNPLNVGRFEHEAILAAAIDSPHVVKLYDAGRVGETLYLALEYVSGWTLARIIEDHRQSAKSISLRSIIEVTAGALRGLDVLHRATGPHGESLGIVHRDLSPRNLMVSDDGTTRIIDLGIGKSKLKEWKTKTGAILGSPGYMAPEQVKAEEIDHRADLYVIGLILFELATLQAYIPVGKPMAMLRASIAPVLRRARELRPELPAELDVVLARALALDPEERFQSAAEMLAALGMIGAERGEEGSMESLLGEMLWSELSQARTEVMQQLESVEVPAADQPVPIVFTRMGKTPVTVDPAALEPTLVRRSEGEAADRPALSAPAIPRRWVVMIAAALIAVAVIAGGVGVMIGRMQSAPLPAPVADAPLERAPVADEPVADAPVAIDGAPVVVKSPEAPRAVSAANGAEVANEERAAGQRSSVPVRRSGAPVESAKGARSGAGGASAKEARLEMPVESGKDARSGAGGASAKESRAKTADESANSLHLEASGAARRPGSVREHVDALASRLAALRAHPAASSAEDIRAALDALRDDLLHVRSSKRIENEGAEARRLEQKLDELERRLRAPEAR